MIKAIKKSTINVLQYNGLFFILFLIHENMDFNVLPLTFDDIKTNKALFYKIPYNICVINT